MMMMMMMKKKKNEKNKVAAQNYLCTLSCVCLEYDTHAIYRNVPVLKNASRHRTHPFQLDSWTFRYLSIRFRFSSSFSFRKVTLFSHVSNIDFHAIRIQANQIIIDAYSTTWSHRRRAKCVEIKLWSSRIASFWLFTTECVCERWSVLQMQYRNRKHMEYSIDAAHCIVLSMIQ